MLTQKQINAITKRIDKFNADFEEFVRVNGESELPTIDSTVIGYDPAQAYTYKVLKTRVIVTDCDGDKYTVTDEFDLEELNEAIKYDKRRLSKAWRVFKSENPDMELEKDDEE